MPSLSSVSWVFYGITVAALLFRKIYSRLRFFLPFLIPGFFLISSHGILSNPKKGLLEADFLDAGNRNIIFIRLPENKTVLFDGGFSYRDGGGYIEERVVSPFLLKSGVTKINYLISTSLDRDHLEGVKSIIQKFRVERLWTNGEKLDGEIWGIIKDKNISWKNILDEVETLDVEGVQIEFLKPRGEFTAGDSSKPYLLIGKLAFKNAGFLFGERIAEERVQAELIEVHKDRIGSGVLYMPRFFEGQKNVADFVATVSPRVIVTNSGFQNSNKPHHPMRINDYGKKTPDAFQTDTQGAITVLTDGKRIRVRTFLDKDKELVY